MNTASPLVYNNVVTRGQLPQRAGLPGLNGGGAADAVPPYTVLVTHVLWTPGWGERHSVAWSTRCLAPSTTQHSRSCCSWWWRTAPTGICTSALSHALTAANNTASTRHTAPGFTISSSCHHDVCCHVGLQLSYMYSTTGLTRQWQRRVWVFQLVQVVGWAWFKVCANTI